MLTAELPQTPEDVCNWLMSEAKARGVSAKVYGHLAKTENQLLIIPVFIAGDFDAFDYASQLQDLEDAWNNQKLKSGWRIILRPAAH